jgi:peptidoglycan/xylan/chitin deacetylase (PgdA/CDA1 family)
MTERDGHSMSDPFFHLLLTRFSKGFVLAFHGISPQRVAEFVDSLQPAQPVPLSELVRRSRQRKSTTRLYAITVDDGVGDNVRALSHLFAKRGWPGTFYLPTAYIDSGEGMAFQWWRRLKPLLPRRKIELKSGVIDLSRAGAVDQLAKKMEFLWHSEQPDSYFPVTMELLDLVVRENGLTRDAISPPAPITWAEVAELSKSDLIRFESHGVSHTAMSALNDKELTFEMRHSRDLVTEHSGHPCRHLAYPFGSRTSIGMRAAAAAALYYDSATTMTLGHVDSADPWLLPRIPLYPENSTLFARVKILLKCGTLETPRSVPDVLSPEYKSAGRPISGQAGATSSDVPPV